MKRLVIPALLVCMLGLTSACGGSARPVLQLNQAEKNIERARAVGAEETPQAALHLKMARDQVVEAKRLMGEEENDLARHNLQRAAADAELAEALARESAAKDEAQTNKKKLDKLNTEGE